MPILNLVLTRMKGFVPILVIDNILLPLLNMVMEDVRHRWFKSVLWNPALCSCIKRDIELWLSENHKSPLIEVSENLRQPETLLFIVSKEFQVGNFSSSLKMPHIRLSFTQILTISDSKVRKLVWISFLIDAIHNILLPLLNMVMEDVRHDWF